jgi:hypothetical protein
VHRIEHDFLAVLDGLESTQLDATIETDTNTIGWLLWHLTRSHDRNVSEMLGRQQLWLADSWHECFNRPPDPDDTGYGHTSAQAASFRSPSADTLIGYHRATVAMIDDYLNGAPEQDFDRMAGSPTLGNTATVQARLVGVLVDALQHVGQAALVRGVLKHRHNLSGS